MATETERRVQTDELMVELRRYLIAVEAFRAEGSEPVWRRERPRFPDWTRVREGVNSASHPPGKETEG